MGLHGESFRFLSREMRYLQDSRNRMFGSDSALFKLSLKDQARPRFPRRACAVFGRIDKDIE